MKKVIALIAMLALCVSLACPVFASGNFVPSITYKGTPEVAPVVKEDAAGSGAAGTGEKDELQIIAVVRDTEGEAENYVAASEVSITTIANIETSETISEESKEVLLQVYDELSTGKVTLPYEKVEGVNAEKMVIRELMDLSWVETQTVTAEYQEKLDKEDAVVEFTFNLGVEPDTVVVIMVYIDGEWVPVEGVVVNEDGSVTVPFQQLGPVVICVEA